MRNKKILLGGLLLLGIGFAAVSTTLYINGTVHVLKNENGFDSQIVFNSVKLNGAVSDSATIINSGKKITFNVPALTSIGDTATINYTIGNNSNYSAQINNLTCTPSSSEANTYLSLTTENTLNGTLLESGSVSNEDTITVKMIRSYAGTEGVTGPEEKTFTYECTLSADAKEVS